MKGIKTLFGGLFVMVFLISSTYTYAQAPYKHSIGVVVGTFYGTSYKTFLTDKLALQADFGVKLNTVVEKYTIWWFSGSTSGQTWIAWDLELNPNLMYQSSIGNTGLSWFAGGGLSLGYAFVQQYRDFTVHSDFGKFGINAIGGVEYTFSSIPLSLQFDFRPGYGLLFDSDYNRSCFDWTIGIGARYIIK